MNTLFPKIHRILYYLKLNTYSRCRINTSRKNLDIQFIYIVQLKWYNYAGQEPKNLNCLGETWKVGNPTRH